jgi:DNA-binding PadR family transcriptional regulator
MGARLFSSTKLETSSTQSIDRGATRYGQLYKMLLLLGSLHSGPLYGNELYHMIQEHDDIKIASFYSLLDRLVADRCLYYEVVPNLGMSRGRRIYTLTHKGYRQFSALLHELLLTDKVLPGRVEIALCFLDRLPEAEVLTLLQARCHRLANQRALILTKSASKSGTGASSPIVSYQLCLLEAELAWIAQMVVALQKTSVNT